jgi:ribosomal protein L15
MAGKPGKGQPRQDYGKGQLGKCTGQDSQEKTAGAGKSGQDSWDSNLHNHGRTARRGQLGQNSRDKTAETVQPG